VINVNNVNALKRLDGFRTNQELIFDYKGTKTLKTLTLILTLTLTVSILTLFHINISILHVWWGWYRGLGFHPFLQICFALTELHKYTRQNGISVV